MYNDFALLTFWFFEGRIFLINLFIFIQLQFSAFFVDKNSNDASTKVTSWKNIIYLDTFIFFQTFRPMLVKSIYG